MKKLTPNYIGQKFGRLEILEVMQDVKHRLVATCQCECGRRCKKQLSNLTRDFRPTKSCGCLAKELRASEKNKTHAMFTHNKEMKNRAKGYQPEQDFDKIYEERFK